MRKLCITSAARVLVTLAVLVGVAIAQGPSQEGRFQTFGKARLVVGGVPPDNQAVELLSVCEEVTKCNAAIPEDRARVDFIPSDKRVVTLADITTLSADYNAWGMACDFNPVFSIMLSNGWTIQVWIGYFNASKQEFDCLPGWQNTGNVIGTSDTDLRWDTSAFVGGTDFDSYRHALTLAGSTPVAQISIASYGSPRAVTVDNFTVNDKVMVARDLFR
jgi:hypothetical protein